MTDSLNAQRSIRLLHIIIIPVIMLFFSQTVLGQFECGTIHDPQMLQLMSSQCIDMDIDEVPVKTIRVSFHIFQKNDGSENIPDNSEGHSYLNKIENGMNNRMANLGTFDYTTSSPHFQDSKIRYEVVATHFWQNTDMWSKGSNTLPNGNALHSFIMSQSIPYKNNSVHLLMPGNHSGNLNDIKGIACDIGCDDWSLVTGIYTTFLDGYPTNPNHWIPSGNWVHELGHNFNLAHVFLNDGCADTPHFPCSKCNNNYMDQGVSKTSFTQCQLSRAHKWLEDNSTVVKSGLPNYSIDGQVYWPGYSSTLNPMNYVSNSLVHVTLDEPTGAIFEWTLNYGSAYWESNNDGKDLEIDYSVGSGTSMNFDVETEYNCNTISRTVGFEYSGSLYSIYPNPMDNDLYISLDEEKFSKIAGNDKTKKMGIGHHLKVYNQYKSLVIEKELEANFGSYTVDVSGLARGLYIIELRNVYFTKIFKVQKL